MFQQPGSNCASDINVNDLTITSGLGFVSVSEDWKFCSGYRSNSFRCGIKRLSFPFQNQLISQDRLWNILYTLGWGAIRINSPEDHLLLFVFWYFRSTFSINGRSRRSVPKIQVPKRTKCLGDPLAGVPVPLDTIYMPTVQFYILVKFLIVTIT